MGDAAFGRFFLPGPTEVRPEVLAACARPMIGHRSAEAREFFARLQPGLRALFGTGRPVYVAAGSATAMMEAGLRAVPRGRVLALVNGAFSERYARIGEAIGHDVARLEVPWGATHEAQAVAERLRGGGFDAVTVCHSETSTGALQPLAEIAHAVGEVPLLVDAVTSLGATAIDFDALGLAWCCTGSQKALALPPGLAFGVASERLVGLARRASGRGLYLDLLAFEEQSPPFTPALPQCFALEAQLRAIDAEGLAARFARHAAMAARTWEWVDGSDLRGVAVLAAAGRRSPSVTCVTLPAAVPGPEYVARVAARGFTVGGGYGKLKPTTFRIGHMGDHSTATLEPLLEACGEELRAALGGGGG